MGLYDILISTAVAIPITEDEDSELDEEMEEVFDVDEEVMVDVLVFLVEKVTDRNTGLIKEFISRICERDELDGGMIMPRLLSSSELWNLAGPSKSRAGSWAVRELVTYYMRRMVRPFRIGIIILYPQCHSSFNLFVLSLFQGHIKKPEFTWVQPAHGMDETLNGREIPDVREFLQSPERSNTFTGFADEQDAMDWMQNLFPDLTGDLDAEFSSDDEEDALQTALQGYQLLRDLRDHVLEKGYSARASIRTREDDEEVEVVVTKTRHYYSIRLDMFLASQKELTRLRQRSERKFLFCQPDELDWNCTPE